MRRIWMLMFYSTSMAVCGVSLTGWADTIFLINGVEIEGTVIENSSQSVVIRLASGQTKSIRRQDIDIINIDPSNAAPVPVPVEIAQAVVKTSPVRLLVAMLKSDNQFWFFKLTGFDNEIETGKDEFLHFIQSVRFGPQPDSKEPKISWTVPPSWISLPASGMRYATFHVPVHENLLELSVTPLGPEAGALLPNVNRWREQLELSPVQETELPMFTKTFEVDGRPVTLVDLISTPP